MSKKYTIRKATITPDISSLKSFSDAEEADICEFRKESSDHRPKSTLRLLYNRDAIHGMFNVKDRYVRCVNKGYHSSVCRDSCVELFLKPEESLGYFNFEFNCGGAALAYYITDPTRTKDGFSEYQILDTEDMRQIKIHHSLPEIVDPEIEESVEWHLGFSIPFSIIAKFADIEEDLSCSEWEGNFYKCGDDTSHPHWASWNPISELNFHFPGCFGRLKFDLK